MVWPAAERALSVPQTPVNSSVETASRAMGRELLESAWRSVRHEPCLSRKRGWPVPGAGPVPGLVYPRRRTRCCVRAMHPIRPVQRVQASQGSPLLRGLMVSRPKRRENGGKGGEGIGEQEGVVVVGGWGVGRTRGTWGIALVEIRWIATGIGSPESRPGCPRNPLPNAHSVFRPKFLGHPN